MAGGLDCRTCGMCCTSPIPTLETDRERLGERFVRLNVIDGDIATTNRETQRGPFKGECIDKCAALRGDVGWGVSCMVYEERPDICREALQPGDDLCLSIRAEHHARFAS